MILESFIWSHLNILRYCTSRYISTFNKAFKSDQIFSENWSPHQQSAQPRSFVLNRSRQTKVKHGTWSKKEETLLLFSTTDIWDATYRVFFFFTGTHQKVLSAKKLIYVNVDSPNLGFPYFNFLEGVPVREKKHPVHSNQGKCGG